MTKYELVAGKLRCLLKLDRRVVGVKIAYSKEEYNLYAATELIKPLEYCVAVKSATQGHSLKFTRDTSGCRGSTHALGLKETSAAFFDGSNGCDLGLFVDQSISAKVSAQVKLLDKLAYGVIIKPIELYEMDPDVAIVIAPSREMMRLIQGYTCAFGLQTHLNLSGNQAICVECTCFPIKTGEINLSMLCSGTRFLARWNDNECGAGIPYAKLDDTVQGIFDTVNGTELDDRKAEICSGLTKLGCDCNGIKYDSAYYLRIQREKIAAARKA